MFYNVNFRLNYLVPTDYAVIFIYYKYILLYRDFLINYARSFEFVFYYKYVVQSEIMHWLKKFS